MSIIRLISKTNALIFADYIDIEEFTPEDIKILSNVILNWERYVKDKKPMIITLGG